MSKKQRFTARPAAEAVEPIDTESVEEIIGLARRELFETAEPAVEAIAAIGGRLESLPTPVAARVLLLLAHEGGDKALTLLERQIHSPNPALAIAAVDALGAVRSIRAAELLTGVAESDPNRELRKEAKRALFKLRSLGVAVEMPETRREEVKPKHPIFRAVLSSFDGEGTRVAILGIERLLGAADRIVTLLNARTGMTHCSHIDMTRTSVDEGMDKLIHEPEHGMLWIDAPVSYCQQLIQDALALNTKSGTAVPRGYYYVKYEIGQPEERYDRPIVFREINPLEAKWDPTLLEHSGDLLDLHEFDGWAFEPEKVTNYYLELIGMQRSPITLPGWSQKERLESIMKRFFEEVVTPEEEARYKFELAEMAYLFLRHDRRLDARRAVAAAVALDDHHGGDIMTIPFMRDLLRKSFALVERQIRGEPSIAPGELGLITPGQFTGR